MLRRLFFGLLVVAAMKVHGQPPAFDEQFLDAFIHDVKHTAKLSSGTAIAVIQNDEIIYQGYFGYQDIENKVKVSADTQFYIASVTKPFTALNALLDADNGKIDLNTTIGKMFPEFAVSERQSANIKDLLTHTSSINNLPLVLATAYSGEHSPGSLEALVNHSSVASSEVPGEFKYTNVGYNIYSVFSDKHFKQDWQHKLTHQIFIPANMLNTTARTSMLNDLSKLAKPYSLMANERTSALYFQKTDATMHAAGGMYATASDLGRFLIAQLNAGKIAGKQVFPAHVIARSHSQQTTTEKSYLDFKRDGYAWGWYTGEYKGQRMLHHFGGFAGSHGHLSFIPDKKIGLVVINNEDFLSSKLTNIVADYIYGRLLGEEEIREKVSLRIDKLKQKVAGIDHMLDHKQAQLANRKWLLSHAPDTYVGKYTHPLLGSMEIKLNDENRFDVSWGVMYSKSTGMNETDKIRVEMEPTSGSVITFILGKTVESLVYAGSEFVKMH